MIYETDSTREKGGCRIEGKDKKSPFLSKKKGDPEPYDHRVGVSRVLRLVDLVDDAVFLRFLRCEPIVAIHVLVDLVDRFAGVLGEDASELLFRLQDVARRYLDVGGLPLGATHRLVDHHFRVGKNETFPFFA